MIDLILNSGLYLDLVFLLGVGVIADMLIEEERLKDEEDKRDHSDK
jgi:hypothetical protein